MILGVHVLIFFHHQSALAGYVHVWIFTTPTWRTMSRVFKASAYGHDLYGRLDYFTYIL
jgi:hypothetical protein